MITELISGAALVAITVFVHAVALTWVLWRMHYWLRTEGTLLHDWIVFVRVAVVCVFVHLIEIGIWAAYFFWEGTIASLDLAVYFSAVTYATIGYGDVTPAAHLRLIAFARRNGTQALLVLLDAPDRWWDAEAMLDRAFSDPGS